MKDIIERLEKEIKADTDLSFTIPETASRIAAGTERNNAIRPADDGPSPPYTTTSLTDGSVSTMDGWLDDDYLRNVDDQHVIAQLDEILLLLIMIRERACGKELIQDLRRVFGADLSPGTVYPHLNDLADGGIIEKIELKSAKIYEISDAATTLGTIERVVNRQVVFSLVMKALLIDAMLCNTRSRRSEIDES